MAESDLMKPGPKPLWLYERLRADGAAGRFIQLEAAGYEIKYIGGDGAPLIFVMARWRETPAGREG